jgi:hypothetical protein
MENNTAKAKPVGKDEREVVSSGRARCTLPAA